MINWVAQVILGIFGLFLSVALISYRSSRWLPTELSPRSRSSRPWSPTPTRWSSWHPRSGILPSGWNLLRSFRASVNGLGDFCFYSQSKFKSQLKPNGSLSANDDLGFDSLTSLNALFTKMEWEII